MIAVGVSAKPFDPEQVTIEGFVQRVSAMVPAGSKLLDAGAGDAPYRKYFRHTDYVAVDFAATPYHAFKELTAVCDLAALPMSNDVFDTVLCTQVLEHVPNPDRVLMEFSRVLKPGGKLLLTVPQSWEVHEAPHDYFRFTRYGLELLLRGAGFCDVTIESRGGYFYFLAERIRHLPSYIRREGFWSFPFVLTFLSAMCQRVLPRVLASMDELDTSKRETLGYACIAVKPNTS